MMWRAMVGRPYPGWRQARGDPGGHPVPFAAPPVAGGVVAVG